MSMDLSSEITAIATAVLAAFAIVAAVFAFLAYRKQSSEVAAIERQVMDQRELTQQQARLLAIQGSQLDLQQKQFAQQAAERRRAQASRVFMWTEYASALATEAQRASGVAQVQTVTVHVRNSGEQPVFDLVISWHKAFNPWGDPDRIPNLLPGGQEDRIRTLELDVPSTSPPWMFFDVDVRFRDAFGVGWLLSSGGQLDEDPPNSLLRRLYPHMASDVG